MQHLRSTIRSAAAGLFALVMLCVTAPTQAAPVLPQPFVATYAVSFRGIDGGTLVTQWRHDAQSGHYIFETRARPSALARFFISSNAFERTTLEVTTDGIRPLLWEAEDGKSGNKGDGRLEFDWNTGIASGTFEGQPVSFTLEPGMEDRLSIQVIVMTALLQGREPGTIAMINGDSIRRYSYTRGARENITSKLGKMEAVIFESTRPNSSRVSRVWHAPSLGYVPVRAEQIRKGKVETVMELIALERDQQ